MIDDLRKQVIDEARRWVGTPFVHQGRTMGRGIDCIGLIYCVARVLDLADTDLRSDKAKPFTGYARVPHDRLMEKMCELYLTRIRQSEMQPGDIYLMNFGKEPQHVAISSGDDSIIHAYSAAKKCTEHSIDRKWRKRIAGFYRYPRLCS